MNDPSDLVGQSNTTGHPTTSAADIAARAAADAIAATRTHAMAPGSKFTEGAGRLNFDNLPPQSQETDLDMDPDLDLDLDVEPQQQQYRPTPPQDPNHANTARERQAFLSDDDYMRIKDLGVDLPVDPSEVPEEFRPYYDELVQSIEDIHNNSQEYINDAIMAIEEVKDFQTRLSTEEGQMRMLLTMALTKPDVFNKAMERAQRMSEDPEYAASMRTTLESQIRLEAAERKERALTTAERKQRASQVETRTLRLAKHLDIDPEFAKRMIVTRIYENEARTGVRDISLREVDEVLKGVASQVGRNRSRNPSAHQQHQRAPQRQIQGVGRDGGQTPEQLQGQQADSGDLTSKLRNAVRQSSQRIRSQGL